MKKPPKVTCIDFETDPIQKRPEYPPRPVGVAIRRYNEKKPRYYAWGHYSGENNCTEAEGLAALAEAWADRETHGLLFQNAQFDVDVAITHCGMPMPEWHQLHDTMFLLFLHDPHAPDLKLKPSAERILGLPPEEQDQMLLWLKANKKRLIAETDITRWVDGKGKALVATTSLDKLGALVAYAPGNVAGPYACGDITRTDALFNHLWPRIVERGMLNAYDTERELMPILLENERVGMRVDVPALRRDIAIYDTALGVADAWLRKRLKSPQLNLDNDGEVAHALSTSGVVADDAWTLTETGLRSVSKKNLLPEMFQDAKVAQMFGYRNRLVTCLKMFMYPWLKQATARGDGYISTNWNQVRQPGGGTRTGRPSTSDPNFLNISKTWDDKDDGYKHPSFIKDIPELPLVRRYILPDKGHVFCHRDYNGQELRLLGHFEDGDLLAAYQADPRMDVHAFVKQLILDITGLDYHRTQVKITNFRRIYGGGAPATAGALNVSLEAAKQLLAAHGKALPGLTGLNKQIKALSAAGLPLTTWGGREYYVEAPGFNKRFNKMMTYEYKLLNYLIQGSAADVTKRAIINYHNHPQRRGRFMVTVYDEINVSAPKEHYQQEMQVLRECMEGLEGIDVEMLTDGKTGSNWASLKKHQDAPW